MLLKNGPYQGFNIQKLLKFGSSDVVCFDIDLCSAIKNSIYTSERNTVVSSLGCSPGVTISSMSRY